MIIQSSAPGHTYAVSPRFDAPPQPLPIPFGSWITAAPEEGRLWLWSPPAYYTEGPPKTVRHIDLTGREVGPTLAAPPDLAPAYLLGTLPDGQWLVHDGADNGLVTVWDPLSAKRTKVIGRFQAFPLGVISGWYLLHDDGRQRGGCVGCSLVSTDLRTGQTRSIETPAGFRGDCWMEGALSPTAATVGVIVECRQSSGSARKVVGNSAALLVDPASGTAAVVPGSQTAWNGSCCGPVWSPDGSWLFWPGEGRHPIRTVIAHHLGDGESYEFDFPVEGSISYAVSP